MADGTVILTDDLSNTGKPLDHEAVTYGGAPVTRYRPRVVLCGTIPASLVDPVNAQPLNAYGIPVWVQGYPNAVVAAQYDDVATGAPSEEGYHQLRITLKRGLHTNPRDAAGAEIFATAAALADVDANPTLGRIATFPMIFNGTTWDRQRSGNVYSATGLGVQAVNPNGVQRKTYVSAPVISPAAFVAGTAKDIWSVFHASGSALIGRLRRVVVSVYTNTVAGAVRFEIYRITAAGTATAHVAQAIDAADAAAACTVGIAHTANATATGTAIAVQGTGLSVTPAIIAPIVLYDWQESGETKAPLMRASVGEGYAIRCTHSAASTVVFGVQATFTEES
jgi:hypothetical protein